MNISARSPYKIYVPATISGLIKKKKKKSDIISFCKNVLSLTVSLLMNVFCYFVLFFFLQQIIRLEFIFYPNCSRFVIHSFVRVYV